jgi:DNA-binding Lrp family transcriptional regulator
MHQDADDAIIALVVEDTRVTYKRVAEVTGLPESTVRARLGRIIRSRRLVPSVLVHPDVEPNQFLYMLRILPTAGVVVDDLVEEPAFEASPWAARSATSGLVFVQLSATTMAEMLAGIDRARQTDGVDEISYSVVARIYVGDSWRPRGNGTAGWASAPTRPVDTTDRLLIDSLRLDGRASYTDLAEVSGLTVAATRRRVLRLVEDGVIRFATRVADGTVADQEASVDIVVGAADVAAVITDISRSPEVRYVIEQSGEYNIACYAVAPDTARLAAAVARIVNDPRVRRSSVDPFLVIRDRLSWTATAE